MSDGVSVLLERLRRALAPEYDVERVLGMGGMGAVFLARDRTLDRLVAVKVVAPDLASSAGLRERFLREARTVARLRHPHIVDVYTGGEADGLLYFVMQCVPGESLRDYLDREKRVPPARAAVILRDLADALAYAHAQGIVHRDIKPENVLLDERTGTAHLTDFGVARALEPTDERMTGTGLIIGSPRYMSPEQAAGERELDGRTDIYSLGLVGYEMLSGEPTFSGASPVSIIAKQITEVPPPVATRADGVPPALAQAIDRAVAKDPNERWQTAAEMAAALRDVVDGRGEGHRAPAPKRRRPMALIGIAAAVVLIAAGVWTARSLGVGASGVDPRKSILVAPFEVQGNDPALAWLREGSVNMLTLNLAAWSDLSVVDYERSLDLLRESDLDDASRIGLEDARDMAREAGVGTVVLGQISRVGDSLIVVARAYDVSKGNRIGDAAQHSASVSSDPRAIFDAIARDLLDLAGAPPMRPELARTTTTSLEAYRAYLHGLQALNRWRLAEADSAFRRATEADSTFALAYYKRSLARGWSRAVTDTSDVRLSRAAARHATRLPQRERALIDSYLQLSQGLAAQTRGDFTAGAAHFTAAERGYEGILAKDSTDAEAWYGLADAYFHHGGSGPQLDTGIARKWTRALRAFDRTLALDSTFHLAYPHTLAIYQVGGRVSPMIILGDSVVLVPDDSAARAIGVDRVRAARERARELALLQAKHWRYLDPDAAQAHVAVVDGYAAAGQFDSAAAALRQTMERPEIRTPDMPYALAMLELSAGSPTALETLRSALATSGPDTLLAAGGSRRLQSLTGASNVAAFHGALPEQDRVFSTINRVEPTLPGVNLPMRYITGMWRAMSRLALGLDSREMRRTLDSSIAALDRLNTPISAGIKAQARGLPIIAYLTTRDSVYLQPLRRWGPRQVPAELEALRALEAGDTTRAMRIASQFRSPDSLRLVSDAGTGFARFAQAELFARLGDVRRAIAIYESMQRKDLGLSFGADPRWPLYARSFLARGQLYEQLGDRPRAIAAYEQFVDIWKDASPELQGQVRLAREGLIRLKDAPGQTLP
ncbi:MAG TPA: serine/threonine-protein kinase [Gemmatimonadaceae bacterium]|nr:serine/threonine-protein kinase [Gemmatimonadaceae bacterium]